MINRWMETLHDVELQRIADAPAMLFGQYTRFGDRCLGLVVFDGWKSEFLQRDRMPTGLVRRYDDICRKVEFGHWRRISVLGPWERTCKVGTAPQPVLTMLRDRARRILARRTLNALTPEAARLLVGP